MGVWKNEDDIKAELRTLTAELRQLRRELCSMVSPPKPSPARTLFPRQAGLRPPAGATPNPKPVAEAADTSRERPPKRQNPPKRRKK
jgi:hypothetical protein